MRDVVVVTCEHAGNRIPARYAHLFRQWQRVLQTHRGFDAGALAVARDIAAACKAPLVAASVSRLVVDLNRSLSNPGVWSEATRALQADEKRLIVSRWYLPHREKVLALVDDAAASGRRVIHIASHSFTPELDGRVRTADVGLLYDPARTAEALFADNWKAAFAERDPDLRVRRNYPYAGKGDGLTRSLRLRFPDSRYVGIELEVNQAFVAGGGERWRMLRNAVVETLREALRRS